MGTKIEAMKFHVLAELSGVETMKTSVLEKISFHAGFRNGRYVPANKWVEADEAKIRYVLMYLAGFVSVNVESL